ncbi:MAG: ABC transporter ATP-binding protein [Myxococcota bacterium]|nr:ABC transporter ATP-binding protein [Myxococcota bacterium]
MSDAAIVVDQVSRSFGAKVAVNQVTLQVRRGECFGLIGPNGAGKTTFFAMLCGFLKPTSGTVRVLGADPRIPGALKGKLGVLPQDAALPGGLSVGRLLTYWASLSGLAPADRHAREAVEKVGLMDAWNVDARSLSHGMAKRIGLAQAFMGGAAVVLLDEPTAGLDPRSAAHVRSLIREVKAHATVVVSSHNLQELEELCDSAAILDRGRLAQAGTLAELTARSAEFRVELLGPAPLAQIQALDGVTGASMSGQQLVVLFDSRRRAPEEMITATLELLIRGGVKILGVTRGKKLEERVLELT